MPKREHACIALSTYDRQRVTRFCFISPSGQKARISSAAPLADFARPAYNYGEGSMFGSRRIGSSRHLKRVKWVHSVVCLRPVGSKLRRSPQKLGLEAGSDFCSGMLPMELCTKLALSLVCEHSHTAVSVY